MQKIIVVDADKCIGCRMCEAVCSLVHYGAVGISHSRIKVIRYDNAAFFSPMVCTQCEVPYCIPACPSKAITKNHQTGVVKISKEKCTGCKMCLTACPFGAITLVDGVAIKCDLCGGNPSCVEFCQAKALTYGSPNDISDSKRINLSNMLYDMYKDRLTMQREG